MPSPIRPTRARHLVRIDELIVDLVTDEARPMPTAYSYTSLGTVPTDEWIVYRLPGPPLPRVAAEPPRMDAQRALPTGR